MFDLEDGSDVADNQILFGPGDPFHVHLDHLRVDRIQIDRSGFIPLISRIRFSGMHRPHVWKKDIILPSNHDMLLINEYLMVSNG